MAIAGVITGCFALLFMFLAVGGAKYVVYMGEVFIDIFNALKVLLPHKKHQPPVKPYVWYETASTIQRIWHDGKSVGTCFHCGMDDAPVISLWNGDAKCKWCAEKDNLAYHLANHGTRRLSKKG